VVARVDVVFAALWNQDAGIGAFGNHGPGLWPDAEVRRLSQCACPLLWSIWSATFSLSLADLAVNSRAVSCSLFPARERRE